MKPLAPLVFVTVAVFGSGAAAVAEKAKLPAPVLRMIVQLKMPVLVPTEVPKDFGDVAVAGQVSPNSPAPEDGYALYFTRAKCGGKPSCVMAELRATPAGAADPLGNALLHSINLPDGSVGYIGPSCGNEACAGARTLTFIRDGVQYAVKLPRGRSVADALAIIAGLRPAADLVKRAGRAAPPRR